MLSTNLENRVLNGPGRIDILINDALDEGIELSEISTIAEIQSLRKYRKQERKVKIWGIDGCAYGIGDNDEGILLYLTDPANNPLAKNLMNRPKTNYIHGQAIAPNLAKHVKSKANNPDNNGVMAFNLNSLYQNGHVKSDMEFPDIKYIEANTEIIARGKKTFIEHYGNEIYKLFHRIHGEDFFGDDGIGSLMMKQKQDLFTNNDRNRILLMNPCNAYMELKKQAPGSMLIQSVSVGKMKFGSYVFLESYPIEGKQPFSVYISY